ncbi:MAG: type II toxin-antitoxin system VapC family toxin [Planctomycetes bacterium]|nr:type II toxin-antitoxin system VapC family toxin [Planctomycetota bacterium]
MRYLLDSNAWIGHLRQTSPTVTIRLRREQPTDVALCAIVLEELQYGALRSGPAQRPSNLAIVANLQQEYFSLPFDDLAALDGATIRVHLATLGQPIGPRDVMIAAIARSNGLTLVTHNTKEFSRVPGLALEDWQ